MLRRFNVHVDSHLESEFAAQHTSEPNHARCEHYQRARFRSGNEFQSMRTVSRENWRHDSGTEIERAKYVTDVDEHGPWDQAVCVDLVHGVCASVSEQKISGAGSCVCRVINLCTGEDTEEIDKALRLTGSARIVDKDDLLVGFAGE